MEDVRIKLILHGEILVPRELLVWVLRNTHPPGYETPNRLERLRRELQQRDLEVPEAMKLVGASATTTRTLLHQLRVKGEAYAVPAPGHTRKQLWRYSGPHYKQVEQ